MIRNILAALLLLSLAGCVQSYDVRRWAPRDQWTLGASGACHVIDSVETVRRLENPHRYETTPGLGSHPSARTVYLSSAVFTALTYYLGALLPTPEQRDGDRTMVMAAATLPCAVAIYENTK